MWFWYEGKLLLSGTMPFFLSHYQPHSKAQKSMADLPFTTPLLSLTAVVDLLILCKGFVKRAVFVSYLPCIVAYLHPLLILTVSR